MSPLVEKRIEQSYVPQREPQINKQRVIKGGITKGEKLIYLMTIIIAIVFLYFILSNYATMYILNHQMQQTEIQINQQENINNGLTLQTKELSDPERILYIAQNELEMTLNDQNVKVIHVND